MGSGRVSRSEPTQPRLGFGLYGGVDLVSRLTARIASELTGGRGRRKALDDALNGPADGDTNRQYHRDIKRGEDVAREQRLGRSRNRRQLDVGFFVGFLKADEGLNYIRFRRLAHDSPVGSPSFTRTIRLRWSRQGAVPFPPHT